MQLVHLYVLRHPITNEIRYVGQTIRDPIKRLQQHINNSKKVTKPHVNAWLNSLYRAGLRPLQQVIFSSRDPEYISSLEVCCIRQLKRRGYRLTNIAIGGSINRGWKHSLESRKLMGWHCIGRSPTNKGSKWTDERRSKMQKTRPPWSEEHRRKVLEWHENFGVKHSDEVKEKLSDNMKKRWECPDFVEKYKETRDLLFRDKPLTGQRLKLARQRHKMRSEGRTPKSLPYLDKIDERYRCHHLENDAQLYEIREND